VLNLGHRHPRVVAAVREQLDRFTHTCFQVAMYDGYLRLAERVGALAVDQGYRYGDNFNGASDPLYFYPLGTNLAGNFVTSPGQSYSIASTSDREVIGNFHYYIKHKHDDGKDDIQFLYANGRILADFYSSVNDLGGADAVSSVIGNTYGYGAPQPAYWQDAYVYTGALMQPLNPNNVATYYFPSSPQHPFQGPLPNDLRDTSDNNFAIEKLQWQRNIDDHSYLRIFAYSSYNNWFINGPVSDNLPYAGEIADYEVNGHTYGLNARYENEIDDKNLITATASYQTQKSETYDSGNNGQIDENLVDAHGNCLGPTGAYVSCFVPVAQGGVLNLVSQYGSTPATTPPYAALPGSQWIVTQNGYNAQIGLVNPYFSAASVGDEFRPTSRLLINAGIRFEDFDYKLIDTNVGPAQTFWFNAWNRENCYYPGANAPVNSSANLDATGTYTACGAGAVPLLNTSPATANYTAWQPRVSSTYTFSPDTVVRASFGRYAQQPGGEYLQYNTVEQNSTTLLQNFLPYGFNTPFHSTAPSYSDSYDLSLEQHIKGTDVSLKVTPFYRVTQNVEQDIPPGTQGVVDGLNTGTGQSKGIEFELTKGDFARNGLAFQLAYTFTNTGTTFGNLPGSNTNFIDSLNTYVQQYNAFTSACAPGGKNPGSKLCGSTPTGVVAAPAYDAVAGTPCASATAAGCVANPYYNERRKRSSIAPARTRPTTSFPNAYYGDVGFVTPTVVTAIVNYRHGKFTFTPSGTYTSGTFYGAPLSTPGYDPSCAALDTLADAVGASFMKIPIDIGALLCCLSIVTAAINGAARALLMMGRTGLMPATLGATHPRFETPARALTAIALIVAAISGGALALGRAPVDAFGDCATLCSYGFVLVYGAVAVGASVYLRRRGELRPRNIAISALAVAFLIVPAIGSVYPAPPPPANWYPLGFLAYAVIGIALLWRRSHGAAPLTADPSPMPRPTTSS
jgi:hypothetical protein